MAVSIYYDADCPFCAGYVRLLNLRDAVGSVQLVDLRADAEARERFAGLGLDPDQGMLVETGGRLFHGADALHVLSLMSSGRGWLDRLCAWLFSHQWLSRIAYPLLRAGRNATLLALGRAPMAREDPGEAALFTLFSLAMGLFGLMHVTNYAFEYGRFLTPTIWPVLVPAIGLVFHPGSRRLFEPSTEIT